MVLYCPLLRMISRSRILLTELCITKLMFTYLHSCYLTFIVLVPFGFYPVFDSCKHVHFTSH